jgi:magnesium-transporting ATPase (P-type)
LDTILELFSSFQWDVKTIFGVIASIFSIIAASVAIYKHYNSPEIFPQDQEKATKLLDDLKDRVIELRLLKSDTNRYTHAVTDTIFGLMFRIIECVLIFVSLSFMNFFIAWACYFHMNYSAENTLQTLFSIFGVSIIISLSMLMNDLNKLKKRRNEINDVLIYKTKINELKSRARRILTEASFSDQEKEKALKYIEYLADLNYDKNIEKILNSVNEHQPLPSPPPLPTPPLPTPPDKRSSI